MYELWFLHVMSNIIWYCVFTLEFVKIAISTGSVTKGLNFKDIAYRRRERVDSSWWATNVALGYIVSLYANTTDVGWGRLVVKCVRILMLGAVTEMSCIRLCKYARRMWHSNTHSVHCCIKCSLSEFRQRLLFACHITPSLMVVLRQIRLVLKDYRAQCGHVFTPEYNRPKPLGSYTIGEWLWAKDGCYAIELVTSLAPLNRPLQICHIYTSMHSGRWFYC